MVRVMATQVGQGYQFACSLKELERLGRKRITVEERVVVVFHVKGQIYALDHFCYRKLQSNEVFISFCQNIFFGSHRRRWSTRVRRY